MVRQAVAESDFADRSMLCTPESHSHTWRAWKPDPQGVRAATLALLSGLLYWLSSQTFPFGPGVWICLVPLGLGLSGASPRSGFAAGLIYGYCFWFSGVWWLKTQLITQAGLAPVLAWSCILLFCLFHAVPYALFGWLAARLRWMERLSGALCAAAALVVLKSWYPSLFPGTEAHNLYRWPLLIQPLDLGGVPLLLFLIFLVNFLVVQGLCAWRRGASPAPAGAAIIILFILLVSYGRYRLTQLHRQMQTAGDGQRISLLAVQANIPVKDTVHDVPPEESGNTMKTTLVDVRQALQLYPQAELVVFPELPISYVCQGEASFYLPPLVRATGRAMLVPCTGIAIDSGSMRFFNSVSFTDVRGIQAEEYRKQLLVPFGEYLPLERQVPALRRLFPGVSRFSAGSRPVLFDLTPGKRLIPSICFEAIISSLVRRSVEQGGNIVVNMVNDAWFGASKASWVHLSVALYRTVEYRIPMVRVANSGISAFIQPTGEIVPGSLTPLFRKTVRCHSLFIPAERSPYSRWGDIFLALLTVCSVTVTGWQLYRNPQSRQ